MKKAITSIGALLSIISCSTSHEKIREEKVMSAIQKSYSDFNNVITIMVDTVTFGDNLDFRIEQCQKDIQRITRDIEGYHRDLKDDKRYNYKSLAEIHQRYLEESEAKLEKENLRHQALDSLKSAIGDSGEEIAAYTYCVAYNYPTNLVWVQIDALNNILVVTKDIKKLLLNPGGDVSGYYEVLERYSTIPRT